MLVSSSATAAPSDADLQFFESKIRPLLVESCYKCHSIKEGKSKGELTLDTRAGFLKGGDNGPVVVGNDPVKSRLIEAVGYGNVDLQMPPKQKLSAAQIADLTEWVRRGAPWPEEKDVATARGSDFDLAKRKAEHWAWQPVKRVDPPAVRDAKWPKNDIDRFILAKLEEKGLRPAERADKSTLIRRASLMLTGLPPTPQDVDVFLADESANAFEKVVDRLLASPRFGERWARHWLDLVRYGETRGHEFDYEIPNAFQYRDYVIRAFNEDVPYDQFVREHIAGDLLPKPRMSPDGVRNESIVGTGFWFLGEAIHSPVDIRQDEMDRVDNQIDVFGKTFQAMTLGCARCHDHKFDALSTKDYYSIAGFMHSSGMRDAQIDHLGANQDVARKLRKLQLWSPEGPTETGVEAFPPRDSLVADYRRGGATPWIAEGESFGDAPASAATTVLGTSADRPIAMTLSSGAAVGLPQPQLGGTLRTPTFVITKPSLAMSIFGEGRAFICIDSHRMIGGPLHGVSNQKLSTGRKWKIHTADLKNYIGQRAHVEFTATPGGENPVLAIEWVGLFDARPDSPAREDSKPTPSQIDAAHRRLAEISSERNALLSQFKPSATALAMLDGSPVDERVLIRGSPKTPGEPAPRRFLEALDGPAAMKISSGSGRLQLADRIADAKNPLTSRVIVNRVWHHLFGRGIVASVDNFGVLGDRPTHPELLDSLADELVKDGWSIKRLIRRIVLSESWQMSSRDSADAALADPQNLLVHRANLRRLEGEAIRDELLMLSGRLDPKMYGPGVDPYLTSFMEGRGRPNSGPIDGAGRRSIYIKVRRNFLSPMMLAFDTPQPFNSMGRRSISNVPAQALILMNDPFVVEQAGLWAKHVLAEKSLTTPQHRIDWMYRSAFSRPPTSDERDAAMEFLQKQAAELGVNPAKWENDPKVWADFAHVLVNVKEFIYVP